MLFSRTTRRWGPYVGSSRIGYHWPYRPKIDGPRILYHSGLERPEWRKLVYPYPPEETTNFTTDVLAQRDVAYTKTLTSHSYTKYQQVKADGFIEERFRPEGGISVDWGFFASVYRMWETDPDWQAGEYILWRPMDRTHKAFLVDIVQIKFGEDENFLPEFRGAMTRYANANFFGDDAVAKKFQDVLERWGINEFSIKLAIREEATPQAALSAVGGSSDPETEYFNINE